MLGSRPERPRCEFAGLVVKDHHHGSLRPDVAENLVEHLVEHPVDVRVAPDDTGDVVHREQVAIRIDDAGCRGIFGKLAGLGQRAILPPDARVHGRRSGVRIGDAHHGRLGRLAGGDRRHLQRGLSDADLVADLEQGLLNRLTVDKRPVRAVQVPEDVLAAAAVDLRVPGRHLVVQQDDAVGAAAADDERGLVRLERSSFARPGDHADLDHVTSPRASIARFTSESAM